MEGVDLRAMRAESAARDAAERRAAARRRATLVLVQRWLCDHGYVEAQERLARESGVCLKKVDVADNVSLESALMQFEEYHEMKYGRPPKLVRNVATGGEGVGPEERALGQLVSGAARARERRERGAANAAAAKQAAKAPSRGGSRGPPKDLSEGLVLTQGLINTVHIPYGAVAGPWEAGLMEFTNWAVMKAPKSKLLYYRTYENMQWRLIDLTRLDFSGKVKYPPIPLSQGSFASGVLDATPTSSGKDANLGAHAAF